MVFVELHAFSAIRDDYFTVKQFDALLALLFKSPTAGDVIPGAGGFRKLRFADPRRGKGARGGLRVIYYYFPNEHQIYLATVYGKDEASDLTAAEKKALREAVDRLLSKRPGGRKS